jgi:hypothetical protein
VLLNGDVLCFNRTLQFPFLREIHPLEKSTPKSCLNIEALAGILLIRRHVLLNGLALSLSQEGVLGPFVEEDVPV